MQNEIRIQKEQYSILGKRITLVIPAQAGIQLTKARSKRLDSVSSAE
jgi:hypothetical protein